MLSSISFRTGAIGVTCSDCGRLVVVVVVVVDIGLWGTRIRLWGVVLCVGLEKNIIYKYNVQLINLCFTLQLV